MTVFKKISLYFAMLAMFQLTNCTDKHMDDDAKYPQISTDFLEYKVIKDTKPALQGEQPHGPEVEKFTNYTSFGLGLERKKVTKEVEDGKIITTTETWTRKKLDDPWLSVKIGAGVGALAAAGTAYWYRESLNATLRKYLGFGSQNQRSRMENLMHKQIANNFEGRSLEELLKDVETQKDYTKVFDEINKKLNGQYKIEDLNQLNEIYDLRSSLQLRSSLNRNNKEMAIRSQLKKIYPDKEAEFNKLNQADLIERARKIVDEAGFSIL